MSGGKGNRISRRGFITSSAVAASATSILGKSSPTRAARKIRDKEKLDIDQFVADCVAAGKESEPQKAVKEVLQRAVSTPRSVLLALGEPAKAGITVLHRSSNLTIFNAAWTPQMNLMPHNHLMWALIGIYTGREDNIMWQGSNKRIEAFGAKALFEGDVAELPDDVIHSVTNPLLRFTGGIHIYGGDFFDTTRSQWDPETLEQEPSNGASIREMFERENERFRDGKGKS